MDVSTCLVCLCSKDDKLEFRLMMKPCMDISMWKGYDPHDHNKNAGHFELWYKRMPYSATVDDTLNKYQVRYMLWLLVFLACV